MNMEEIPFIQQKSGMDIRRIYFALPMSDVYGNLGNFYRTIITRNQYFNKLIAEIYTIHKIWKMSFVNDSDAFQYSFPDELEELNFKIETLAYWLRKSSDELISLQYFLLYWTKNPGPPEHIKVDSIGKLLSDKINDPVRLELSNCLQSHHKFMNDINNVSNTFKHSFINYEVLNLIGENQPTLNALGYMQNKIPSGLQYFSHYLKDIIFGYNAFYFDSLENITKVRDELYIRFQVPKEN